MKPSQLAWIDIFGAFREGFTYALYGFMTEAFEKKHHQYAGWSKDSFSEIVTVKGPGTLLFLSGIGSEETGDQSGVILHPGDVYQQTRTAYEKAVRLLARHGASLRDVVKITTYLLDTRECPNYHRARREAFAGIEELPAHTLVIVQGLAWPGMVTEVDLTAVIPSVRN